MKEAFVLLLICVVLIGGIAAWTMHVGLYRAPRGIFAGEPQAAPPAETETPKPAAKPAKPKVAETVAVAEPAPAPAPAPEVQAARAPAPVAAAPPRPFPAVDQIRVGLPEDTITDEYGDPALSATTSDRGHMVETFVYARDGRRDVTVISLEDGKVSSAYSRPRSTSAVAMPPPLRRPGS